MEIFSEKTERFNLAQWERTGEKNKEIEFFENSKKLKNDDKQFVLLQLSDGDKRILSTSEVNPILKGDAEKPDINMLLDFEGFHIGSNEKTDENTKATLQLKVGQEESLNNLDKLFYCINGGLELYDQIKNKKSDPKDFKKNTDQALGKKPISLPKGIGQISLQVVKHQEPKWWQQVFNFTKSDGAKELFSMVGFGGITQTAVSYIGDMLNRLFDEDPEILFESQSVKACFTQSAKEELTGGLSTNYASSLNPGYWVMARKVDYELIVNSKPIYYGGYGVLAPEGMGEIDAIRDSTNNPFSKITYAVIRAKMKELNLSQGIVV